MKINTYRIGERWVSNEGFWMTIISYVNATNCDIQFDDGCIVTELYYANVVKGRVRNPYHPSVFGVGYMGIGEFKSSSQGKHTKIYKTWVNMLKRCYHEKSKPKTPTYDGVTVHKTWHNFQIFAEWCFITLNLEYMQKWELDKDILIKGNKIYSPETCCFVPRFINTLFVKCDKTRGEYPLGVYKNGDKFVAQLYKNDKKSGYLGTFDTIEEAFYSYKIAKEGLIKNAANEWKHEITPQTYQAMYNYQVEITD